MKLKITWFEICCIFLIVLLAGCSNLVRAASLQKSDLNSETGLLDSPEPVTILETFSTPVVNSIISIPKLSTTDETSGITSGTPQATLTETPPAWLTVQVEIPSPEFQVCSPIAGIELDYLKKIISDPYRPPPPGSDKRHEGVDFSYYSLPGKRTYIEGVGIQSVLAGRVTAAIANSFPYGNFVIIETPRESLPVAMIHKLNIPEGGSLYLLYAHMETLPLVNLGDQVRACQQIGKVGHTGNALVAHLHLEARLGPSGSQFGEMAAFQATVTVQERANYKLWRTSGIFQHFDPMLIFDKQ